MSLDMLLFFLIIESLSKLTINAPRITFKILKTKLNRKTIGKKFLSPVADIRRSYLRLQILARN